MAASQSTKKAARKRLGASVTTTSELDGPGCGIGDHDEVCLCDVQNAKRQPLVVVLCPSNDGLYPHESSDIDFLTTLLRRRRFPFEVASLYTGPYQAGRAGYWADNLAAWRVRAAHPDRRLICVGTRVATAFCGFKLHPPNTWAEGCAWVADWWVDNPAFWKETAVWLRRVLARTDG